MAIFTPNKQLLIFIEDNYIIFSLMSILCVCVHVYVILNRTYLNNRLLLEKYQFG